MGALTDAELLRKNTVGGSSPAPDSWAWSRLFTAWATTRHGVVTGERSGRRSAGTPPAVADAAARTAPAPLVRSSAVLGASASTGNASCSRWTYHRSAVWMTLILRSAPWPSIDKDCLGVRQTRAFVATHGQSQVELDPLGSDMASAASPDS